MISSKGIASILILVIPLLASMRLSLQQQQEPVQKFSSSVNSSNTPIWMKPGCHRVGHTRTISIPGCVRFNLSTNACRGYCLSFSIPALEDLGPPVVSSTSSGRQQHQQQQQQQSTNRLLAQTTIDEQPQMAASIHSGMQTPIQVHPLKPEQLMRQIQSQVQLQPLDNGQLRGSEKRDIISMSQCCNMMETEDVIVNLRCGVSEIRRLIFKSAKTCECFFCKHF